MWRVERIESVLGAALPAVPRVDVVEGDVAMHFEAPSSWVLRGVTGDERYVNRLEHDSLVARQEPLGRQASTQAALIPIKKSDQWWQLPRDTRRDIFEESSHHIAIGLEYLPAIARRLHHGRDLGEPFDFLTWFEFAPADESAFDELVRRLRGTEEWKYVEREVDIRLAR